MVDRTFAVWPWWSLAALIAVPGIVLLILHYDEQSPPEQVLTHFSGSVDKVMQVNDIVGHDIGVATPFDSIHFTLKGQPETFVFASALPGRGDIYRRLSHEIDIWADQRTLGQNKPLMVYRIEQRLPANETKQPIAISYQQIAAAIDEDHRSYERIGAILMVVAAGFFVIGKLADIWNKHRHELLS